MSDRIKKARQHEGGFTLIELLVVIVILGVLAAVVVFSVGGLTGRGEHAACETTKDAITIAQEASYAQNGHYPLTIAALVTGNLLNASGASVVGDVVQDKAGLNFKWQLTYSDNGASVVTAGVGQTKAIDLTGGSPGVAPSFCPSA